ncbi:unnamed protein product [Protopolystoma xenopodis]|uniref:Uncharacterized protein n=1 Tax=Protopolystoma xenopodis TaxID=117903 RepID=A0A3S4ZQZ1_9PLAT|nr:unnamed protein product [Protopolystoma xenopodis]
MALLYHISFFDVFFHRIADQISESGDHSLDRSSDSILLNYVTKSSHVKTGGLNDSLHLCCSSGDPFSQIITPPNYDLCTLAEDKHAHPVDCPASFQNSNYLAFAQHSNLEKKELSVDKPGTSDLTPMINLPIFASSSESTNPTVGPVHSCISPWVKNSVLDCALGSGEKSPDWATPKKANAHSLPQEQLNSSLAHVLSR